MTEPDLDRLDARATDYRFALADVPWDKLSEPGALVGPTLQRLLDFPQLDGGQIAVAFASLERDLIRFLEYESIGGRSVALLLEEESRHAEMFERFATHLGASNSPPDTFRRLREVEDRDARRYLFWLHCLFFEELTVWIYDALARDGGIQPAWLAAHRLHAREETQHVLTDAAFLAASPAHAVAHDRLARAFVLYLDQHIDSFFGIPNRGRALRDLPLFDEILSHRAFGRTRTFAPYLVAIHRRRASRLSGPELPDNEDTLPAALERASGSAGGITLAGRAPVQVPYAELLRGALQVLGGLQSRGLSPGRPVVVVCGRPGDAVAALWACLLGGLVPALVPLPSGGRDSESHRRLFRVAAQLDAPLVTDQGGSLGDIGDLRHDVLRLADLRGNREGARHASRPDDLALLQYSSGSLGQPRGVRLTHRQVLANVRGMTATRGRPNDRFASWLPLSHDMGLVGFHLAPIVLGCDQLIAPPRTWLRSPAAWLDTLDQFGATVTGLPASALPALLAEPFTANLSALHTVLVGAEPIDPRYLRAVADRLAPLGLAQAALCPAYGMAEATLAVTMHCGPVASLRVERESLHLGARVVPAAPGDEDYVEVVRVGAPISGLVVRAGSEAGEVGEIFVSGASVGDGYQGQSERWGEFATGDLGFIWDGGLYVCGRIKETFEVNGQTFHAHDVERIAQEVPGVRQCALGLGAERVLFVVPVAEARGSETLWGLVRRHLRLRLDFEPDRIVAASSRELLRTTSGKLRRNATLDAWRDRNGAEEVALVRKIWSEVLELPLAEVGPDDHFRELGGSSIRALEVHARLEESLHRELGHEILQGTTPREVASRLGGRPAVPHAAVAVSAVWQDDDPLVIVALAVRFPGAATPAALWELIREGRTTVGRIDRWDTTGLSSGRGSLFPLESVHAFDPAAFGLREDEARGMDPQHYLALELAAEALQEAPPDTDRVGVYLACGDVEVADREDVGPHTLLGSLKNMVAGRISGTLGLTGPALAVDTACSASLVAVHLAAKAVRAGECDLALAGGVQLLLTPQGFRSFDAAGLLSSTGESQPLDRGAAGLVPGEGGAVVVITTLSRARRLGHRVLALLRGSAVTNDGGGLSSTAPSPDGQQAAIVAAWQGAGINPIEAGYLEAHAAGTAIGDAVEATAATRVFGTGFRNTDLGDSAPPTSGRVPVASVKGNLGHTLAASGVAGLARAVLSIRNAWLPPSAGLRQPTGRIDWSTSGLMPLREGLPWAGRRVAGVSSFGLGGTNAHVVVEAAQSAVPAVVPENLPQRLRERLVPLRPAPPVVALVLAGPGGQHAGMARALRDTVPAFAVLLDRCDVLARGTLLDAFDDDRCLDIAYAQQTTFALSWALGRWLLDLGLQPAVVMGHSGGELAAAVLTGVLTLEEGWSLAVERGRLMARVPGGLLAVLGELEGVPEGTWIAARNAPGQVVLSGSMPALQAAARTFGEDRTRWLAVRCPAHSPLLQPEAGEYLRLCAAIPARQSSMVLLSTRTAAELEPGAEHWHGQLFGTVEFAQSVRVAAARGATVFVDVGPSSGLAAAVRSNLGQVVAVSLLSRTDASYAHSVLALESLIACGAIPRLAGLQPAPLRFQRRALGPATVDVLQAQVGDHVVLGQATLPAASLYDQLFALTGEACLDRAVVLRPCPAGAALTLHANELHADGIAVLRFAAATSITVPSPVDLAAIRRRCTTLESPRRVREDLARAGMVIGERLWALRALITGPDELLAELVVPRGGATGHLLDPALLDSASQAAAALGSRDTTWVGFAVERLVVYAPAHGRCLAWLRVRHREAHLVLVDLDLVDDQGAILVAVEGMSGRPAVPASSVSGPGPRAGPRARPSRASVGASQRVPVQPGGAAADVRTLVARRLGRDPASIPIDTPFAHLGIDSLAAVELAGQIEQLVGRRMPVTLLFECANLAALEARLALPAK